MSCDQFILRIYNREFHNVFVRYSPRALNQHFEPATYRKINTEVTNFLPENSKGFLTSIFREDEIDELFYGKHRLCLEILKKKKLEDPIAKRRSQLLGFLGQ